MISAFGVDHGEVSKAFSRGVDRLTGVYRRLESKGIPDYAKTMPDKVQGNYAKWRWQSGLRGKEIGRNIAQHREQKAARPLYPHEKALHKTVKQSNLKQAKRLREGARAMTEASANMNRRKKRVLP